MQLSIDSGDNTCVEEVDESLKVEEFGAHLVAIDCAHDIIEVD